MNAMVLINAQICVITTLESLKEKGIYSQIKTGSIEKLFDLIYATRPETDFSKLSSYYLPAFKHFSITEELH